MSYCGKILRVNLSKGKILKERLDRSLARNYIGGGGLAARILYDELPPKIDPFSPRNKLAVAAGPLVGTTAPCSGRHIICAKSPLTGLWGEADSGGFFGAELKFAGYDVIIAEGRAKSPVYLWINDDEVKIKDALGLWGKDVYEATDIIQSDSPKMMVACIGPGGENLVRFAAVVNDKYRAAGRTGLGAVMGSKNLKAIAVRGTKKLQIAKPEVFNNVVKRIRELIETYPGTKTRRAFGTSAALASEIELGNLPTKYFQEGVFEEVERISGETLAKTILVGRRACFMCPIGCGRYVEIKTGPYAGVVGGGPEFETIASFGSLCLNDNLESIAKANDLCNRFGLDTISTGSVIAFAMECYERRYISREDGFDLKWGDHEGIVNMVQKIASREGFGNTLAEGVRRAAKKIGKSAEELAMHVKGLEIPMIEPRAVKCIGLQYATSPVGAVHKPFIPYVTLWRRGVPGLEWLDPKVYDRFTTEGKAKLTKAMQDLYSIYNALNVCMFAYPPGSDAVGLHDIVSLFSSATGFEIDTKELLKIGERIWNLKRLFNVREGVSRKDDTLPKRFLKESHSKGPCVGQVVELNYMLNEYYDLRGWSRKGIPTMKKLKELDLRK